MSLTTPVLLLPASSAYADHGRDISRARLHQFPAEVVEMRRVVAAYRRVYDSHHLQADCLVAALLRVAGVTAGLAESSGSLPPGI